MRIALLTEGGYPYVRGESVVWCDRLLRGLGGHEFEVYALSRSARQESAGWCELPDNVGRVRTAPLWGRVPGRAGGSPVDMAVTGGGSYARRDRRRFGESFHELAAAICGAGPEERGAEGDDADGTGRLADRFATGLHGLAALARERGGGLPAALRSEQAVRILQSACRAPGALRAAQCVRVPDLLAVAERLERALRPLSLDWYGDNGDHGLADAELCHVVGGGPAALPALLAKRAFGTPLLITEYGVRLREHYLASAADAVAPTAAGAPVRALLASFQRRLAREAYGQAQLITPGNTHARRWQERCGARRDRLRTVYPGMDAEPFAEIGETDQTGGEPGAERHGDAPPTLVWAGRIEPTKDLTGLLHAFLEVRRAEPRARLRIIATAPGRGPEAVDYEAHCRALAAQLFPDEAAGTGAAGDRPVTFEELGGPGVPTPADAYGAGWVVVLSSVVEGFPVSLVEAMFCGRATVSTDVGAVCEVIGGTGLVVPSRNPRALADRCLALLRDPERRARLGAAARERALELFTVEQNVAAFRGIYLELMSRSPVPGHRWDDTVDVRGGDGPLPFARPAESHVPGRWAGTTGRSAGGPSGILPARAPVPSWARPDLSDSAPIAVLERSAAEQRQEGGR
ncbi:MAG: DUF3492 domain-containing protein [Streptomyces sp.]|uniref:DUF3492 domain-containing protein n=1 Tax=Streptomyces sp. TaxID=1931 RepID=UPI003D6AFEFE